MSKTQLANYKPWPEGKQEKLEARYQDERGDEESRLAFYINKVLGPRVHYYLQEARKLGEFCDDPDLEYYDGLDLEQELERQGRKQNRADDRTRRSLMTLFPNIKDVKTNTGLL
ncbi:hypothetical protein FHS85_005341 [Rhodoligotrophos appendicifer]|uniref:hypothetical protein n=1 Tax=Rhodoligotrophos appendicifer TaxID=987056 RepID=UPI001184E20F|nr:hypothetical protein [Rhodoligotrophos appendicifer]